MLNHNHTNKETEIADLIIESFLDDCTPEDHQRVIDGAVIGDVADDAQYTVDAWEAVTGTGYDASGDTEDILGISINLALTIAHDIICELSPTENEVK